MFFSNINSIKQDKRPLWQMKERRYVTIKTWPVLVPGLTVYRRPAMYVEVRRPARRSVTLG